MARDLLVCAAYLAPAEPIPAEWLKKAIYPDGANLTMILLAEDGLSCLVTLGFLKRVTGQTVMLHLLLASFTQEAIGEEGFGAAQSLVVSSLTQTFFEHMQKNQRFSNGPIFTVHLRHVTCRRVIRSLAHQQKSISLSRAKCYWKRQVRIC